MAKSLYTRWGRELDSDQVLQEYPRPGMVRESYYNLNGYWNYAFTGTEELPEKYDGKILVPFSPEAPLSGVNRQLQPDQYLHYQRTFRLPEDEKEGGWLLHFGAVDQSCTVCINGVTAGSHTGGYLPFSLDVTETLREGDNLLQVIVRDLSDTSYHAKGSSRWNGAVCGIRLRAASGRQSGWSMFRSTT